METMTPPLTEAKGQLRKSVFLYVLSGIFLIAALSGAILIKKYTDSLYATFDRLQEFSVQYIKVRSAIDDIEKSVSLMKGLLPQDFDGQAMEEHMLLALDDLKTKAGAAELIIANIEDKGADLQLPVAIRAQLKDYTSLVNYISYLQSLKFPFFSVSSLKLQRNDDPTMSSPSYEIKGILKFPKSSSGSQGATIKDVPGKQ